MLKLLQLTKNFHLSAKRISGRSFISSDQSKTVNKKILQLYEKYLGKLSLN